jgi:predicted phosphodiesterase
MKLRLLSDIHQEFYEDKLLYGNLGEDVLVLAGDINVGAERTLSALRQFANETENIIYVPGNHEYYGGTIAAFDDHIRRFTRNTSIHFLNPGSVKLGDVTFIGAALWTNFRKDAVAKFACSRSINDFNRIKGFDTDQCSMLHTEHFKYIEEAYAKSQGKKIIVTHFLPAIECISAQYRGTDLLNYYFANDHGDYISTLTDTTWLFGHTHDNVDVHIGDTRCIANPYGYNRNPKYKEMILDV